MLSAATTDIVFSTRAKSYTTDVLVVLVLALILPHFAERRWGIGTAVAWVGCAVIISSVAAIAPLATIAAGMTLATHPRGDRTTRTSAIGVQVAVSAIYVALVLRTYNDKLVRSFWSTGDAFIRISSNPIRFGRTIIEHFVRVASVFPGGAAHWATLSLVLASAGLLWSAWRGTRAIVARFLVLTVVLAFAGSLIHRFPFGPRPTGTFGRITLWLIPAMGFGLAAALDFARAKIADRGRARAAFDGVVFVCVAIVLISTFGHPHPYQGSGGRLATHRVMAQLGSHDAVWIARAMTYSFALSAGTPVRVRATPKEEVGFQPEFADPRLHVLGFTPTRRELAKSVKNVDAVYVVLSHPRPRTAPDFASDNQYRSRLNTALRTLGFVSRSATQIGTAEVDTWLRAAP
jgi:hypothetical protein